MQLPKTGDVLLGKYLLEERLGEGGMGVVYAARHSLLAQRVAVKLIRPEFAMEGEAVARFINEARAAARIENEHVARVLDVGMLEERYPYMVLEFLDGTDLSQALRDRGPLPVTDVADYLLQAIAAVAHAHSLGIVHRDLKPSNLFLARRPDGTARVKVLDFGISKVLRGVDGPSANLTRKNAVLGSPHYMSPEQLRDAASADHRADIWAFGIVAYELLAGKPPFDGDNAVAVFAAIQGTDPASLRTQRADVDENLERVILRCLRRQPEERFDSVTELGLALASFGTVVAARALESVQRILPLQNAARSPNNTELAWIDRPGNAENDAAVSSTLIALPEGRLHATPELGKTENALSTSHASAPATRSRRVGRAATAATILAAGVIILSAALRHPAARPTLAASGGGGIASSVSPSLAAASSLPADEPPADPPARAQAAAPVPAVTKSHTIRPRAGSDAATPTVPRATPPPIPSPIPSCSIPYSYDGDGTRRWKPECFKK